MFSLTDEPLSLSADERNRFLTATIRQALINRSIRPFVQEWYRGEDLTRAELDERARDLAAELERGLLAGEWHLDLRLHKELSQDELREFAENVVRGRCHEGYDAEDFYQDALSKLLASPPDFLLPEFGQDAGKWVRSVTWNHRRNAGRDERGHRRILREQAGMLAADPIRTQPHQTLDGHGRHYHQAPRTTPYLPADHWLTQPVQYGRSAEQIVMQRLDELDLARRIFRLPPKLADVAWLRFTGCTRKEIAATLEIPEGTVDSRLNKIRSPRICRALEL